MSIITALFSILILTALARLVTRTLQRNDCAICAAVAGTWLWMLIARAAGFRVDPLALAILMGGSAVGLSLRYADRLPPKRSRLVWKVVSIVPSFGAAYALASEAWIIAAITIVSIAIIYMAYLYTPHATPPHDEKQTKELEQKMEQCC